MALGERSRSTIYMITIRNKTTGEIRKINEEELSQYGIGGGTTGGSMGIEPLINQYIQQAQNYPGSIQGGRYLTQAEQIKRLTAPENEGEVGVTRQSQINMGKSGLNYLQQAKDIYEKDPSVVLKQKIPGQYASRDFDNALFGMVENLLRLKSGAAVPEQEVRRYMTKLAPNFGDNPQVVQQKFNNLAYELSNYAGTQHEPSELSMIEGGEPTGLYSGLRKLLQTEQESVANEGIAPAATRTMFPALQLLRPEGRKAGAEVLTTIALANLLGKGIGAIKGGKANPFKSSVSKVGEKEAASVAGRSGQAVSKKEVMKVYDKAVLDSKATTTQLAKLQGPERARVEQLLGKGEYVPVDKATNLLRTTFKAEKADKALMSIRNKSAREGLTRLLGGETAQFTGQYSKAYGTDKLRRMVGYKALSTGVQVPMYLALGKALGLLGGGSSSYQ